MILGGRPVNGRPAAGYMLFRTAKLSGVAWNTVDVESETK